MTILNTLAVASQESVSPSVVAPVVVPNNTELLATTLNALGENLGEWRAYDSQLPIAEIKGTRIVKALYQLNPKTGLKAQENAFARIPTSHLSALSVTNELTALMPHFLAYLQTVETDMLKEEHKKGQLNVFTEGLSLNKIINKLEATSDTARLTKVDIESWYVNEIQEPLTVLFAAKMGLDENSGEAELVRLEKVLGAYKAKFASLASPKVFFKDADCVAMVNVINSCKAEDTSIGSRFLVKLVKMQEKEDDLLLCL